MVAFRCLASLFDSDLVSDVNSNIEFDSSKSCEYVLQCILDEIPLSELKPGAQGLSKWNLQPFIKSKLLCLPKCALELMIESSSCEKNTEVSPCNEHETLRSDGKKNDRVTPPMADPDLMRRTKDRQSFFRGLGDGADEISRSHELLERRNEGFQNESDGHVSSPVEKIYRCIQCKVGSCCFALTMAAKLWFIRNVWIHHLLTMILETSTALFVLLTCATASAQYLQSQDEVAKAKKKLVSFLSLISEVNKKKSIEGTTTL